MCIRDSPDPDANNMDEAQYVIERHKMSRTQLRSLKKRPYFRDTVIDEVIEAGESYVKKYWEDDLSDYAPEHGIYRFEVLEYWGAVDVSFLKQIGKDVGDVDPLGKVQINAWICGNKVLRMVENPFTPKRIPYLVCPYELNPYQFFVIVIPEKMKTTKKFINV